MKSILQLALLIFVSATPMALAQERIAEVLTDPALNMKRPADRAKAVARMKAIEDRRLKNAQDRGRALGIPLFVELPNGGSRELVDFDEEGPVFRATRNIDAAISTTANLTWSSPYNLSGTGLIVGVWDSGVGRTTHQEFATGSRLVSIDSGTVRTHSMHVAGTIGALGVNTSSRGMANAAKIHSYTASNDKSELTSAGATAPNQTATKIYTSNHSYGPDDGWVGSTWGGTGTDQNAYDSGFGQYSFQARDIDSTIYNTPYLASFWACGNDRSSNPANGSTVTIGGQNVTYDSAIHPPGDGVYRGGYETISAESIGKNAIAVGCVDDAVTSGNRDLAKATLAGFSSTGPADDGRIKPDLVANGIGLFSTNIGSDTDYTSLSGTSMASPNACGSATLLIDQYKRLLNSAMRASTLKALLIHAADDLGNPGPDYFFGWGLVNVKRGADIIASQAANPLTRQITESSVSTTIASREYSFIWDGASPIKASIAWTDPAAFSVSTHDSRTPVLINNLNLKIIAPDGTEHFPYVMPFVGTWTVASMSANATTGVNNVDNVEQVRIAAPAQAGIWRAQVSYAGALTNTTQDFGLIISGLATDRNLTLNPVASSVSEAAGNAATTATVSRTGTSGDLVVSLASGNTSEITVPASVTIPNGQSTSPPFNISSVDDLVIESTQTATLTATAFNHLPAETVISVTDNDNQVPVINAGLDQTVFLSGASPTLGWSYSAWTGDADTDISDQYTYTAKHCFGNNHASVMVNNVTFTGSFGTSGTGWSVGGAVTNWEGDDNVAVTGASEDLAEEFIWGGSPRTVTFTGLTVGKAYQASFFSAGWDPVNLRVQTFSGTGQTPLVLNQNFYGDNNGIKFSCIYVATGTSQTLTITPTTGTFHLYAMFNREMPTSSAVANLDGTVSDGDGHTLATAWSLVSGPASPNIDNFSSVDTTALFSVAGAYTFLLTANDGFTQVTDQVVVHVNPAGSGYTMTYLGNGSTGGSVPVDATPYTLNATVTVLGNTGSLTRTGFNFTGWNTEANGSGTSYAPAATFSINTNTTLHAQWIAVPTYTVSFDGNGSTGGSVANQIKTQNVDLPLSGAGTLVRIGYAFSHWNTQANGLGTSYAVGANYTDNAPITLFTQWTALPTYTVSFVGNGNTGGSAPGNQTKIQDINLVLTGGGTLTRTGFSFAGWNTADNGSGTSYAAGANYSINADLVLYAKWNVLPVVNAGPNQTIFLTGGAWSPLDLAPKLWLDADDTSTIALNGATVSQWSDKSGFNRHATALTTSQPTATAAGLNGKRVVTFDATSDVMNVDLNFLQAVTHSAFIVTKPTTFSNIYGAANGSDGANSLHVGFSSATGYRMNYWANDYGPAITANFVSGSANIMNYVWTSGASKQILANGKSEGTTATAGVIGTMSGGGRIGRAVGQGYFGGDIAEFIICTGAVTSQDRQKAEGYLAHKWGLTARLDAAHPHKTTAPNSFQVAVNLDGTATDADPLTYTWTIVSGPAGVTLGNANSIDTAATFTAAGTYTLRLTANDGFGQNSDDVVITVNPAGSGLRMTYAGNGSTGGSVPVDSKDYLANATVTVLGNTGSLIRTGYSFAGWNTVANGTGTSYAPAATFSISANTTLHAQWTANTYAVSYDGNSNTGGTVPSNQSKTHDSSLTLASNSGSLSRTGHTFAGWNTQTNGTGTSYAEAATYTANAPLTLFAKWTMTPYTAWTMGTFANPFTNTALTANPDGDTLINLLEFAFGMDPTSSALSPISYVPNGTTIPGTPILEDTGASYRAVFGRRKDHAAAGISYQVQFSANLLYWKTSTDAPTVLSGMNSDPIETVSIPFPATVPLSVSETEHAPPKFFRLVVSGN